MENNTPAPEVLAQTPISEIPKKNSFNPLWILALVAILLLVAGVVLYSQKQNKTVKPVSSSISSNVNTLGTELNSLDDGTSDADLNALEKDLQNL